LNYIQKILHYAKCNVYFEIHAVVGHQQSIKGGLRHSFGLPGKFYSIISNDGRNNFLSEQLTVTLVNKYDLLPNSAAITSLDLIVFLNYRITDKSQN
jgi:hypothetical protein